jgi:hypothetical protein
VGNTIKLVSGFILFVIGVLIAFEASVYNLLDILLIVGLIISIVGIILMVSYFVDSSADKTSNKIKDFLESRESNNNSMSLGSRKSNSEGPLKVRRDYNDYNEYEEASFDDFSTSYEEDFYEEEYDDSKSVLTRPPESGYDDNPDNQLNFTPYYGKPVKVTRAPKRREGDYYVEEVPEFVVEPSNNAGEIQQALAQEPEPVIEPVLDTPTRIEPEVPARDIRIDVNNPESLPVPSSLNSYVIAEDGVLTSQEAFENLAVNVTKEIMLEIPSLNDLSDRFLSHVPTIYSRVIINEFDLSDMSYMFLISSLLKQGVHIKTVPKVHSINLITDDSYAMIISESKDQMEYGAIYNDRTSISNIRADFEKTWNIASNLDESLIISTAGV